MPSKALVSFAVAVGRAYRLHRRGVPARVQDKAFELLHELRPFFVPDERRSAAGNVASARADVRDVLQAILGLATPADATALPPRIAPCTPPTSDVAPAASTPPRPQPMPFVLSADHGDEEDLASERAELRRLPISSALFQGISETTTREVPAPHAEVLQPQAEQLVPEVLAHREPHGSLRTRARRLRAWRVRQRLAYVAHFEKALPSISPVALPDVDDGSPTASTTLATTAWISATPMFLACQGHHLPQRLRGSELRPPEEPLRLDDAPGPLYPDAEVREHAFFVLIMLERFADMCALTVGGREDNWCDGFIEAILCDEETFGEDGDMDLAHQVRTTLGIEELFSEDFTAWLTLEDDPGTQAAIERAHRRWLAFLGGLSAAHVPVLAVGPPTSTTTTTRTSTTATRAPATTTPSPPQAFTIYSDEEGEDADALDHRLATSEEDAASSRWCTLPSRAFSGRVWAAKPSAACTSRWPPSRASSSSRARAFRVRDVHDDDSSSSELDLADLPALLGAGIRPSELLARSRLTIAAREALTRGPIGRPVDYSRWDALAREVELEEAFDDVLWPGAFSDAEREAAETDRVTHLLLPAPGDELAEFGYFPGDFYGGAFL